MAPPCLATIFEGDNGGATTRGVSSTEIRVGVALIGTGTSYTAPMDALFEYFNQHFELYGRRLVPVYLSGTTSDPVAARSRAAEFGAADVFATLTGQQERVDPHPAFPMELARQGIVTVTFGAAQALSDRQLFDALHPYVWSVYPSTEDLQANMAAFACSGLAGKPARFAGDPALQATTRRFGVLAGSGFTAPSTSILMNALADCSERPPVRMEAKTPDEETTAMQRFKADGVTTMFCICEDQHEESSVRSAHAANFHPEWILTPTAFYSGYNEAWVQETRRLGQQAPPIYFGAGPRLIPAQARPWWAPLQSILATTPAASARSVMAIGDPMYPSLLLLASGIQAAGPQLSADTFAAGLMGLQFPNPGAGEPPYWQPTIGFGPGDHSLFDDYHVGWWSDTAPAMDTLASPSANGSWCYLQQARRFTIGRYPTDADNQLFNPTLPCR